jgi:DUF1680 family protein
MTCNCLTRREFFGKSVRVGAGFTVFSYLGSYFSIPLTADTAALEHPEDYMAYWSAVAYRPYVSKSSHDPAAVTWVQIDMGESQAIDAVKLYPSVKMVIPPKDLYADQEHFPVRFKLEASDDPQFQTSTMIADQTAADYPNPHIKISEFPSKAKGRYVRLTVTKWNGDVFALAKMDVLVNGKDAAEGKPVQSDPTLGGGDTKQLTRPPRPMGEGLLTDNPDNVLPKDQWKPVPVGAVPPLTGVKLADGLFQTTMENNISYLLKETADDLLQTFRTRAGKTNPPGLRKLDEFWDGDLPGSGAGRFMMAAGNTLRWMEHSQLREQLNALVDGIEACAEPDGYIMAYPRETIFYSERGAYTRSWVTQGLIEVAYLGNAKVFPMLRRYYDWYNHCEYLPKLLRGAGMGFQGMVANTRLALSPVGKPEDIQVVQRYFQENYWLDGLANRGTDNIWLYPYDRPHSYLITFLEAYLDMYRATGAPQYLDAMIGAWDLFHEHWEHLGGTISLTEFEAHPPDSYRLLAGTGEFCGNVFWVRFNQRFHQLYPDEEKYVNEIEKSIYNVALANQVADSGIIYHAKLSEKKEGGSHVNTCCEGQGSRLYGSLPEYIYSITPEGLMVNLYEGSTITWTHADQSVTLKMTSTFPYKPDIALAFSSTKPVDMKIRVRVPAWASGAMDINLNGAKAATGLPGSYVTLERTWKEGDAIAFTLPIVFRLTPYRGVDRVPGHTTYGLEYGPILYAMVGEDFALKTSGPGPEGILKQMTPKDGQPLHFTIAGNDGREYMPYWQVGTQRFTCFPIIDVA